MIRERLSLSEFVTSVCYFQVLDSCMLVSAESSDGRGKYFGEIQIANEVRMRHGHGQLQLHNGSILLGQWVSNMLHGFAIQTNPDSSYCIGLYQNWVSVFNVSTKLKKRMEAFVMFGAFNSLW